MIAQQRHSLILEAVEREGTVTVSDLASELGISESTVRRDLSDLSSKGLLEKVHGGATALEQEHVLRDLTIDERAELHSAEKRLLGEAAAKLVGPEDCVYIDAGTTVRYVVDSLTQTEALYVTDSVANALALVARGIRVVLVGGELKGATEALVGPEAAEALSRYHFTIGFFGANGITAEQGMTTPDRNEAMVKRLALRQTERPYVVTDASKFGRCAAVSYAGINDATILTNAIPPEYQRFKNIVVAGS